MSTKIIKQALVINEGRAEYLDVMIQGECIEKVDKQIQRQGKTDEINGENLWLLPGIIDDQVHFREPGLTHKADIASESKAAVAGGVTSFMEMPNTQPATLTQALLQEKYDRAHQTSYANYSFFMGASNDNYDEVMRTNVKDVCGIKIFMGSSTGNMLVDNQQALERLFANVPLLIATHCEDETTIKTNLNNYPNQDELTATYHPLIRSVDGCYLSSKMAVDLARKHGTRLHILHISTADELVLFTNQLPLSEKKITAEVCVHHLYYTADDYARLGNLIKCNPAIKASNHKFALMPALLDDTLDIIATDHAPHTWDEKQQVYIKAPSGLPLIQHSLNIMMEFYQNGIITKEKIVQKMCHAPAICFGIQDRGFIKEGFKADLSLFDPDHQWVVNPQNIHYKCAWSPLDGHSFTGKVAATYVNGHEVYNIMNGFLQGKGQRLVFNKK